MVVVDNRSFCAALFAVAVRMLCYPKEASKEAPEEN
tara:strand:+ start:34753 stop:34860 length:108 start_codon:yes stop_codon:yes gene_type:complete